MIPVELEQASYLNLATFRKNGMRVDTPVWFASDNENLYIFSADNAGKVKRLRNSCQAQVAACTVSGKLTHQWYDAQAQLLENSKDIQIAMNCLQKKYGWQMTMLNGLSRLGGRINKRAYIRITLNKG